MPQRHRCCVICHWMASNYLTNFWIMMNIDKIEGEWPGMKNEIVVKKINYESKN